MAGNMVSAPPIDPYLVLGVEKDADTSTIKRQHRKLVLQLHPDRIKCEADRARAGDEFQRVMEAWELLSDPSRRSRYDDSVKLAQLRKEVVGAMPSLKRNVTHRDGIRYEERTPSSPHHYWAEGPSWEAAPQNLKYEQRPSARRESSRIYDDDGERRTSARRKPREVERSQREEATKEERRERERRASKAKAKDREVRRERRDRPPRQTYVVKSSDSDGDIVTYSDYPWVWPTLPGSSTAPQRPTEKRTATHDPGSHETRGRGFWGSDPSSPRQTRPRASSVCSNTSSRNGSLRGHDRFDAGYQQPTYSRPRAGSAGSAGSRYDIDRKSPGLPPVPRPSKPRHIVDADDQYHRTQRPSMPARRQHPQHRPERPLSDYGYEVPRYTVPRQVKATLLREEEIQSSERLSRRTNAPSPDPTPRELPVPDTGQSKKVECDICGLEIGIDRKRDWQKHIFEDLRPYQCLDTACPSADETYATCKELLAHIQSRHPHSELLNVKELACPFCQEELPGKRLQRLKHVGGHMEEIALSAVTGAFEENWAFYSDSEKNLSSVGGDKLQLDKKLPKVLDVRSARSEIPSALKRLSAVHTEADASSKVPTPASGAKLPGQARVIGWEDWSCKPADEEKWKQRRKARRTLFEPELANFPARSAENMADGLDASPPPKLVDDPNRGNDIDWAWSKPRLTPSSNSSTPAMASQNVLRRTRKFARARATLPDEAAAIDIAVHGEPEVTHQVREHSPPISLATSPPRPKTTDRKAITEVASHSNDPPKTATKARKTENPTKRRVMSEEKGIASPKPTANSTETSQQTKRAPPKKDRPRVERTGGVSSWGSWTVSSQSKKKSVPSSSSHV